MKGDGLKTERQIRPLPQLPFFSVPVLFKANLQESDPGTWDSWGWR